MKNEVDLECFKKGTAVEVSSDEAGLRGSWFIATVLRPVSKMRPNKVYVEYKTLVTTNNIRKPLAEFVDTILVRPLPPRETSYRYNVMDEVDAFHHDGWWEGIVISVFNQASDDDSLVIYSVFFRHSREQIDFHGCDLRLHREWVYGHWVPPLDAPPHHATEKKTRRKRKIR